MWGALGWKPKSWKSWAREESTNPVNQEEPVGRGVAEGTRPRFPALCMLQGRQGSQSSVPKPKSGPATAHTSPTAQTRVTSREQRLPALSFTMDEKNTASCSGNITTLIQNEVGRQTEKNPGPYIDTLSSLGGCDNSNSQAYVEHRRRQPEHSTDVQVLLTRLHIPVREESRSTPHSSVCNLKVARAVNTDHMKYGGHKSFINTENVTKLKNSFKCIM